jgi:hypothetical protein
MENMGKEKENQYLALKQEVAAALRDGWVDKRELMKHFGLVPEHDVRESVVWFSQQMEAQLKENDYKGGWDNCTIEYLYSRTWDELIELADILKVPDVDHARAIKQCADTANFLMMLADLMRKQMEELENARR